MAGGFGLVGVHPEHPVVVGGAVLEFIFHLLGELIAVSLTGFPGHAKAAEGVDPPLEGPVGLKAHNDLFLLVQVAGLVGGEGGDGLGVHIQHPAELLLQPEQALQFVHQAFCPICGRGEEAFIPQIGGVVLLDKIPQVDLLLPVPAFESLPSCKFHGDAPLSFDRCPGCQPDKTKRATQMVYPSMLPRQPA